MQRVLDIIIEKQNELTLLNAGLDRFFLTIKFDSIPRQLHLKRSIPVGQLKQFKADFMKMNKHSPIHQLDTAGTAFVDYIQSFENDY